MNLQHRIDLLVRLGQYILSNDESWQQAKQKAEWENAWFIPAFTDMATEAVAKNYLQKDILEKWTAPGEEKLSPTIKNRTVKSVGIVMAGNIPLVGFHDWLCVFIAGHNAIIKPSSKDYVLIKHLLDQLALWEPAIKANTVFAEILKGCDAYIATGSNNSSRYFDYYFGKYPHIIRKNRTSVAILNGDETTADLEKLADDVHLYFGLGCRNVTKIYVPAGYDFVPLLEAFKKYSYLADHHKYKNNYDYNLALHILNKKYYMTNGSVLLIEDPSFFSPISQLNYSFYENEKALADSLQNREELQCLAGKKYLQFGQAQAPRVTDYADGVDTLAFLSKL